MTVNREYFTLVFKGDIGKFALNPMNTETPFGRPVAAGRGDAFEESDRMRSAIEDIVNLNVDPEIERLADAALAFPSDQRGGEK